MAKRLWLVLALGLALIGARPALADVWDVATNNDNTAGSTENDLVHGSDQIHDLGDIVAGVTADEDSYTVGEAANSSYEIVVDGTTGDIGGVTIERFDATGTSSLGVGGPIGVGYSQHLAWDNAGAAVNNAARVNSIDCPGCDTNDQYRIRFYDTTCAIARYNNSATQITVMVVQNTTSGAVNGHYYLWNRRACSEPATNVLAGAKRTFVRNTSLTPGPSPPVTNDAAAGHGGGRGRRAPPASPRHRAVLPAALSRPSSGRRRPSLSARLQGD
jgi:hypothetical protein